MMGSFTGPRFLVGFFKTTRRMAERARSLWSARILRRTFAGGAQGVISEFDEPRVCSDEVSEVREYSSQCSGVPEKFSPHIHDEPGDQVPRCLTGEPLLVRGKSPRIVV